MSKFKDTDIQSIIGWTLRIGVLVSMLVVAFGGILFLYRYGGSIADYHVFKGVPEFVQAGGLFNGLAQFKSRSIIQIGIMLLIATPILRVVFSAIGFVIEKDYLYIFITLIVLGIIFFSMMNGYAG
jgi:uncharacterized membrane protein